MEHKGLSAYAFERTCELSNGYLGKQLKGSGAIGSDILEKIHHSFPELSLIWLISGKGEMIFEEGQELSESSEVYQLKDDVIDLLKEKIKLLEKANADKEKIIELMEERVQNKKSKK